jgi:hypothetical protein
MSYFMCGSGARWCARADAIFDVPGMRVIDVEVGDRRRLVLTVESGAIAAFNICRTRVSIADVATSIGFRPTPDDERILREAARPGETTTETLRRALRLLDHDRWLEQFRTDAEALQAENLNAEPEAW